MKKIKVTYSTTIVLLQSTTHQSKAKFVLWCETINTEKYPSTVYAGCPSQRKSLKTNQAFWDRENLLRSIKIGKFYLKTFVVAILSSRTLAICQGPLKGILIYIYNFVMFTIFLYILSVTFH